MLAEEQDVDKPAAAEDCSAPAPDSEPEPKAPSDAPLTERQSKWLLTGMTIYVIVLAVLAVDQIFELGLVRPELDRDLIAKIESLDPSPGAVPSSELGQLRQAAMALAQPNMDPRIVDAALTIHDSAYAFRIGSMPDDATLKGMAQKVESLREAKPPVQPAAAVGALVKQVRALADLTKGLPPDQQKRLRDRHSVTEYIINYHEFSISLLIRALRKATEPGKAASAYCLHQIAARFFNHRGAEGGDPEQWKAWWRATEAELERRSRR